MSNTTLTVAASTVAVAGGTPADNRDYTIYPTRGLLTATGNTLRQYPTGATSASDTLTLYTSKKVGLSGQLTAMTYTKTLSLYDLVTDCSSGMGYVPAGVTVVGFIFNSGDNDGGTAIVQSIVLGSTTLVSGLTNARTGAKGLYVCVPTAVTAPTQLYLKTTTAPTTAVSASTSVTALYYS